MTNENDAFDEEPIHGWFGLTYANYLTLPRTLLQSMPSEWQRRFVQCLAELDYAFRDIGQPSSYLVQARDADGKFILDPIPHYNRGRARIEPLPAYEYTCNACYDGTWRSLDELRKHRREQHLVPESEPPRGKKRSANSAVSL